MILKIVVALLIVALVSGCTHPKQPDFPQPVQSSECTDAAVVGVVSQM
jgi:hypothetical protein